MVVLIPARGGSKGIPGKNIKKLCGVPLIDYTVSAALKSECVDDVVVTTDSEEIAEVAKKAGARVPFMRPPELAGDNSSAVDVYIHAIEFLMEEKKQKIDKFMVMLPTSPLRDEKDIDAAYDFYIKKKADTLIAVTEAANPPGWFVRLDEEAKLQSCNFDDPKKIVANRQTSSKYYVPCGAIYILDYKLLKEKRTYYSQNTVGYVMERDKAADIDDMLDFEFAEFLMNKKKRGNV